MLAIILTALSILYISASEAKEGFAEHFQTIAMHDMERDTVDAHIIRAIELIHNIKPMSNEVVSAIDAVQRQLKMRYVRYIDVKVAVACGAMLMTTFCK